MEMLTDKHEKFLGPTFYLGRLKRKIFIYNFTKKMKVFSFVGAQILTTVMIFTLAVLHRSIMSLGYLAMCVLLFVNMKDFFYQDQLQRQNRKWLNPQIMTPLLMFSFVDVAMQIIYQMPFFPNVDPENKQGRYLGFDKIYNVNENVHGL